MSLYGPINSVEIEIRLLSLLPGKGDAPIICHLETLSLSSSPEYLALSCLPGPGSPSDSRDITVNDSQFRACQDVFAALHRLRHHSQPRKVWIHAICTNQQDHDEKAQQVLLMGQIYQQALRVFVWLGESTALSIEWTQVCELFARPWWRNVWAIQAAVLAKSPVFMCGPDTATWDSIKKVKAKPRESSTEIFGTNFGSSDPVFETFYAIKRLRDKTSANQSGVSIYELMYGFRHLTCENQRDKIYAFLGMGSDTAGQGIVPNYDDSIPTTQMTNLPSWVPNWTTSTPHDPLPLLDWSSANPRYSAAGTLMKAQLRQHPSPSTLVLGGIRFDQITTLSPPWHPSTSTCIISRAPTLAEWEPLALTPHESCPYNGARGEALWRTYIADFTGPGSAPPHHSAYLECWYDRVGWTPTTLDRKDVIPKWTKHIAQLTKQSQPTRNPLRLAKTSLHLTAHGEAEYGAYLQRVQAACAHRRLLVTRRGWMGLAPWNAEVRDVVAVLYGGKTPFVLRPEKVPGEYGFVGECFVQGIMGGEALGWEFATAAARDFRIV
ncbi:heterokaryon incompatibility protein-domain-containing protein [Lasiosphaeria hispida]|uniref:Heterokaryon incompatibility protein-domain-containing protein n=1 Tax=Lasiosphaeria hispida TaxID=260671 RepID=A0AAJ0MIM8_9PEZI|nr:heterokaryon incompatibility protein-domain-containing protein [Lasiosphaeria hispida]